MKRYTCFAILFTLLFFIAACGNFTPEEPARENSNVSLAKEQEETVRQTETTSGTGNLGVHLPISHDIERIVDRGKLIVGIYANDMPPFFMTDEKGGLYGYDISIAKEVARQLNVDIEFDRSAATYQELFEKVAQGKVDVVISKFSITYERAKYIKFTTPYLEMRRALLVNRESALAFNAEDYPMDFLRGGNVKIGVKSKTSYAAFARELFPDAELIELPEWQDVVDLLMQGEITAAMYDELEVIKLVRQRPDISLFASVYILKDKKDLISMAVPEASGQLLSWLNWFLEYNDIEKDVNALIKEYPEVFEENVEQ